MKREYFKIESLSIQILQYEFLGPIPLEEWGPPMEKLVYLILSRTKDKFDMLYVGDCKKTNDPSFFTQHSRYKCWAENFGTERSLYLAVLPLFESSDVYRANVVNKIIRQYKPFCNPESTLKAKPDYVIKTPKKTDDANTDDANTDDANTDDANTDDANTDDANTDDANTDDANTDDANTDDANTDDANTDDANTDDANTDNTNTNDQPEKFVCPCCGSEMKSEKTLKNSTLYRCASCGLSDTRIDC